MTRTELIARALADELRRMAEEINGSQTLRCISFDVKLKSTNGAVRTVIVRTEYERTSLPEYAPD